MARNTLTEGETVLDTGKYGDEEDKVIVLEITDKTAREYEIEELAGMTVAECNPHPDDDIVIEVVYAESLDQHLGEWSVEAVMESYEAGYLSNVDGIKVYPNPESRLEPQQPKAIADGGGARLREDEQAVIERVLSDECDVTVHEQRVLDSGMSEISSFGDCRKMDVLVEFDGVVDLRSVMEEQGLLLYCREIEVAVQGISGDGMILTVKRPLEADDAATGVAN